MHRSYGVYTYTTPRLSYLVSGGSHQSARRGSFPGAAFRPHDSPQASRAKEVPRARVKEREERSMDARINGCRAHVAFRLRARSLRCFMAFSHPQEGWGRGEVFRAD